MTPSPSPSIGPRPPHTGRAVALAAAVALVCGGCSTGDTTVQPPPSASPDTQRVDYRGLTLDFPEDWTVELVEDVVFDSVYEPGRIVEDIVIAAPPDQPGCADLDWTQQWAWRDGDCVHVKVFGPGAIRYTGSPDLGHDERITEDADHGRFVAANQPIPCPDRDDLYPESDARFTEGARVFERVPVGGHEALYREYSRVCADGVEDVFFYDQRTWLLPEPEIFIVDEYGIPELDAVLAAATSPSAPPGSASPEESAAGLCGSHTLDDGSTVPWVESTVPGLTCDEALEIVNAYLDGEGEAAPHGPNSGGFALVDEVWLCNRYPLGDYEQARPGDPVGSCTHTATLDEHDSSTGEPPRIYYLKTE